MEQPPPIPSTESLLMGEISFDLKFKLKVELEPSPPPGGISWYSFKGWMFLRCNYHFSNISSGSVSYWKELWLTRTL